MSNLIPPLLSSSPPLIVGPLEEDDDDEFGDFRAAINSYDCDEISAPSSPETSPDKEIKAENLDINSNNNEKKLLEESIKDVPIKTESVEVEKDFQDRRKSLTNDSVDSESYEFSVNSTNSDPDINASVIQEIQIENNTVEESETDWNKVNATAESDAKLEETEANNVEIKSVPEIEFKPAFEDFNSSVNEDFGDFENFVIESNSPEPQLSIKPHYEIEDFTEPTNTNLSCQIDDEEEGKLETEEEEDDEFGNFETPEFPQSIKNNTPNTFKSTLLEENNDFASFQSPSNEQNEEEDDDSDDFGEFGDFSSHSQTSSVPVEINVKDAFSKSESILKEIFPEIKSNTDEFNFIDETKGNRIFNELKDITETNALIYQWSKSNSQKMFLKALNIDLRNILYGPAWNSWMPRFAANLGTQPLEPIKSDVISSLPVQSSPSPSISSQKPPVGDSIPSAQFDWSGSGLVNPLDSSEPASVSTIVTKVPTGTTNEKISVNFDDFPQEPAASAAIEFQLEEQTTIRNENVEDFEDFSSFESPKMVPLRETHISNDIMQEDWLKPTIVTPDLPRKEAIQLPDDDEFDDFQQVMPEQCNPEEIESDPKLVESKVDDEDDDEFTDFHSSAPPAPKAAAEPVHFQPLTPTIQYATPVSTQINWPDPGVSDEDIRNIELNYWRKSETSFPKAERAPVENSSKDDEEWSDFVSVGNQFKVSLPERTATPDLPLSVLNLGNVQAPKQPIPVITPSGLVQTKLSSNLTLQQKMTSSNLQPTLFKPIQSNQFQPAIVSSQFMANFYQGTNLSHAGFSPSHAPQIEQSKQNGGGVGDVGDDDDDWTDFVSSQPQMNGYANKQKNWTSATPNIITNPSHSLNFEQSSQEQQPQIKNVGQSRSNIASISTMPDLDFIAPNSRSNRK